MFKVGDKVVCIDNTDKKHFKYGYFLQLNEKYTIIKIDSAIGLIKLKEIEKLYFNKNRFKTIQQIRNDKINKLCSKLEIK